MNVNVAVEGLLCFWGVWRSRFGGNGCDCESMNGIMRDMMSNRPVATSASETFHVEVGSDQEENYDINHLELLILWQDVVVSVKVVN